MNRTGARFARRTTLQPADFCLRSAFALEPAAQPTGERQSRDTSASEDLLVEMWQRRAAVEHALHVASELYNEAEAAAMKTYSATQRASGASAETLRRRRDGAAATGVALSPTEREAAVTHLLEARAALAESELLAYAARAASWSEFIALNPLLALSAAAGRVGCATVRGMSRPASLALLLSRRELTHGACLQSPVAAPAARSPLSSGSQVSAAPPDASPGQSIQGGRRYVFASPVRPASGTTSPQQAGAALTRGQMLRDLVQQSQHAALQRHGSAPDMDAGSQAELLYLREELARSRKRCAELARAEREAREASHAASERHSSAAGGVQELREQLNAAEVALSELLALAGALQRRHLADAAQLAARNAALRNQLVLARDATEAARWDAAAATERTAKEQAQLLAHAQSLQDASQAVLCSADEAASAAGSDAAALRVALAQAEARCVAVAAQRDAAAAQAAAALTALAAHESDSADARRRAKAAEDAAAAARSAQVHLQEALHAAASQRATLEAQVSSARQRLDELLALQQQQQQQAQQLQARSAPSQAASEVDWLSEAAASETSSVMSEADLAAIRGGVARTAKQREEARARSALNKARFDAIKAERNSLRTQARIAAVELDALRAEAARVEELRAQLAMVQSSLFL